ncbi:MAG: APC family permease [Candidatus Odinarchaeum yellowstonii]|uniref:APC family permease n=1 Tax=Odinarchaeota yellowstonii (strain LCB_4) TaxID=1841599 RepID=A0AAF0D1P7_ODILC|nr:MAG: APC family permease [Candidatus Odinarchaeum yellowstonii]
MSYEEGALKREIGWYGSFAMGYADVGADIYVALGLVAFYAAGGSPIAFAIAATTYVCTGLAYAELATAYPYAGGAHVYAMKASNDLIGFIAGWAVMLDYTVNIALFSLATSGYLSFFFPFIRTLSLDLSIIGLPFSIPYLGLISFSIVLGLIIVNIIGIKESSTLNVILVTLNILVLSMIFLMCLILAFNIGNLLNQIFILGNPVQLPNVSYIFSSDYQFQNFLYGITIAMSSFIGIESIAQAAEETKKPYKWIPRANKLSILAVVVFALGLSTIGMGVLPWNVIGYSKADPMATLASAIPVIGQFIAPLVAATGFAICLVSTNTGVIGVSRVVYSMSRFNLFPKWFYATHKNFKTPYKTIIVFSLIGGFLTMTGTIELIADLYNFGALLSYLIVNVSLIILRNQDPNAYRSWKIPGELKVHWRGRKVIIPPVSVFGVVMCAAIWMLIILYHPEGRLLGFAWIIIGLLGYAAYRIKIKQPILSRETGKTIKPSGYNMNAVILLRTPEEEDKIVNLIKEGLDKRFSLTLLTILDPESYGLPSDKVESILEMKKLEDDVYSELSSIASRLQKIGYQVDVKIRIGSFNSIIISELESEDNDTVVFIKRKLFKKDFKKDFDESTILYVTSRYPGKVMVLRRD